MRDALAALLTSTVMAEDGGRVLVGSFPSVSALRELKYCGPLEPVQASALKRVLFARCGALGGKKLVKIVGVFTYIHIYVGRFVRSYLPPRRTPKNKWAKKKGKNKTKMTL